MIDPSRRSLILAAIKKNAHEIINDIEHIKTEPVCACVQIAHLANGIKQLADDIRIAHLETVKESVEQCTQPVEA